MLRIFIRFVFLKIFSQNGNEAMEKRTRIFSYIAVMLSMSVLMSICTACDSGVSASKTLAEKKPTVQVSEPIEIPLSSAANNSADKKTEPEKLGYIKSFDVKTGLVTIDPIEWITKEDSARVKELGLNAEDDFPDGFYIYNPSQKTESLKLSQNVEYYVVKEHDSVTERTDLNGLNERIKECKSPYHFTIGNGIVLKIEEQYLP